MIHGDVGENGVVYWFLINVGFSIVALCGMHVTVQFLLLTKSIEKIKGGGGGNDRNKTPVVLVEH